MTQPVTEIAVRIKTIVNLGNYENIEAEITVKDRVREGVDSNSAEAIDRVWELVETKLAEKLEGYGEKPNG